MSFYLYVKKILKIVQNFVSFLFLYVLRLDFFKCKYSNIFVNVLEFLFSITKKCPKIEGEHKIIFLSIPFSIL